MFITFTKQISAHRGESGFVDRQMLPPDDGDAKAAARDGIMPPGPAGLAALATYPGAALYMTRRLDAALSE